MLEVAGGAWVRMDGCGDVDVGMCGGQGRGAQGDAEALQGRGFAWVGIAV